VTLDQVRSIWKARPLNTALDELVKNRRMNVVYIIGSRWKKQAWLASPPTNSLER
jgi:hypothetical protein